MLDPENLVVSLVLTFFALRGFTEIRKILRSFTLYDDLCLTTTLPHNRSGDRGICGALQASIFFVAAHAPHRRKQEALHRSFLSPAPASNTASASIFPVLVSAFSGYFWSTARVPARVL